MEVFAINLRQIVFVYYICRKNVHKSGKIVVFYGSLRLLNVIRNSLFCGLTLKVQITTAADNILMFFLLFSEK